MRNKVNNNIAGRILAILLTLVMTAGTFSLSVFAEDEASEGTSPAEVKVETAAPEGQAVNKSAPAAAPAESESTPSPAVTQPAAAEQPAAESRQTEKSGTPEADTSPADNGNTPEETQPATEEAQPAEDAAQSAEDTVQPAEDAVRPAIADTEHPAEEASQPKAAGEAPGKDAGRMALIKSQAVRAEAKAAAESSDAGTHKLSINSSEMPRTISLSFYIKSGNVITEYLYDGTHITDMTNDKDVTAVGLIVAAGSALTVQHVVGLDNEKDFQRGDSPSAKYTKQLKLILKDSSGKEIQRLSLNNSSKMTSISLNLDGAVTAVIAIANRVKVTSSSDIYHKGSCVVDNMTDNGPKASEFAPYFAMNGDKISIDYGNSYERVDTDITDADGKSVAFKNGSFTMPASKITAILTYYYKARNVNVVNTAPERGTISIKKDKYSPGDKVVINIKANSGYKFDTKTLAYLYKKDGKWAVQKITKDKDGKYSFIMPFYDIDLRGVFVSNETAAGSSNPASFIDYSAYADDEEEEAEAVPAEEENLQEMLDVTPLVSRIVAETVMTATVSMAAMIQ